MTPRGSKLSLCLSWVWRKLPNLRRNFRADSPLQGQHQGTALEAEFAEEGKEYKEGSENTSIVLQFSLAWSEKQRRGLARDTTCMGCQNQSKGSSIPGIFPRQWPGVDTCGQGIRTWRVHSHPHTQGIASNAQQLTGFLNQDLPLDHCA